MRVLKTPGKESCNQGAVGKRDLGKRCLLLERERSKRDASSSARRCTLETFIEQ